MPRPSQCGVCGMFELCLRPDAMWCAEKVERHRALKLGTEAHEALLEMATADAKPYYAPFTPADPKTCTCIDPFSCCPTHG